MHSLCVYANYLGINKLVRVTRNARKELIDCAIRTGVYCWHTFQLVSMYVSADMSFPSFVSNVCLTSYSNISGEEKHYSTPVYCEFYS
jgi:hypothetical protein